MTPLLLMLLAAQPAGASAAPPTGAAPPVEPAPKTPLPSAFAAHAPRIEADLRALNHPTLTRGEAVRAALDLRMEALKQCRVGPDPSAQGARRAGVGA